MIASGFLVLGTLAIRTGIGSARAQSNAAFPVTAASSAALDDAAPDQRGAGATGAASGGAQPGSDDVVPPPIAPPGGPLAATGTNVRVGDLREALAAGGLGPPREHATRNWTISPTFGVGEEFTDNVLGRSGSGSGDDLITLIQPGIDISATTIRLQGSLSYHPEIDIYARHSGDTQVAQNFGGQFLGVILPGTLFLDVRGYGNATSNGLGGSAGTAATTANGATQTFSVSISPYALRRFGSWGTGEIGGNFSRTTLGALTGGSGSGSGFPGAGAFDTAANQNVTSYSGHAAFETGEAFDRYNGTALGYATKYDGSGVLNDAVRDTATIDNGYALTRLFTVLGRVGYEHIRYAGSSPTQIDDAIWDGGLRLSLGPDSTIEVRYGHHDGLDAASLDLALAPTARTRLYLRYSEGLSTEAEQLQNALASSDFDPLGNPVDHSTGAPLLAAGGFFGPQDNLYRSRVLSFTGELVEPRDVFSVSVNAEQNDLVSSGGEPDSLGSNKGLYCSLDWSHTLSPTLSMSVYSQYGVLDDGGVTGRENVGLASVALIDALSPSLSAQLRYSYDRRSGGGGSDAASSQNVILLSLEKSF